ncbi:MAG: sigma-70 family RNA polymerase sigma factor [Bacteroidetes bacterium]|nr:sigma-70 family RNA polymerase sigma factor [Bacteroidota bacterium]
MLFFNHDLKKLSDEALMEKASQGSERALGVIYHRYSQPLLRYFYRMLWQDKAKAEDFLHDLFIRLLDNQSAFDSSRKFSTWLYSIAHNMCKNEYRKQAFRRQANHLMVIADHTPESAGNHMDQLAFQQKLDQVLSEEDEDVRTMFSLRFELEMDLVEIARVLQCPEGTVKSRLFYLKKRLASRLEEYKLVLEK